MRRSTNDRIDWLNRRYLALAGLLGLLGGCSSKVKQPELERVYRVNGCITYRGSPAGSVRIVFLPVGLSEAKGYTSSAKTDEMGNFELTTFNPKDGAPEGDYVVTLYWPSAPIDKLEDGAPMPADQFAGAYANATVSPLRAKVESKKNKIDFDIP